jgi:antirestriction protein ArdC
MSEKVYQIITDRIIESLDKGIIPWKKSWNTTGCDVMPCNGVSNRQYNGINFFLLSMSGFSQPYWFTKKQILDSGNRIKYEEFRKSMPVVYWQIVQDKKNPVDLKTGKQNKLFFCRYYEVWNIEQTTMELPVSETVEKPFNPIEQCENIANGYKGPSLGYGGSKAYYSPSSDHVQMPNRESFHSPEHYYATLFHELGHSTGHKSRLGRKEVEHVQPFGTPDYSREELVAEMTSAFLCHFGGIDSPEITENAVAYLQGWKQKLREDIKAVVYAASRAQKAANLIMGKAVETEDEE